MSPLTKTFVVLVTVLSVLLVALVVPFVANTQDLRAQLQQVEGELSTAEAVAANAEQQLKALRADKDQTIAQLREQKQQLTSELSQAEGRLSDIEQKLTSAQARNDRLAASYDALAATAEQNSKLLDELTQDLQQSQGKMVDQSRKIIELSNRNTKLESSLYGLTRQVRSFKEQVQSYQDRIDQLQSRWAEVPEDVRNRVTGEEEGKIVSIPPQPIAGQVTAVDRPSSQVTLVQINVGAKDRVEKDMRFLVHRGDQFLGTIVIDRVDADQAVGRLKLQKGRIQQGDNVYAGT